MLIKGTYKHKKTANIFLGEPRKTLQSFRSPQLLSPTEIAQPDGQKGNQDSPAVIHYRPSMYR